MDVFADRAVELTLPLDLPNPVLIDPLEGTFEPISRSPSGTFILPVRDYPLILTSRSGVGDTPSSLLPREEVYNFPNPVRSDSTFIRFYLSQPSSVQIRIYNRGHEEVGKVDLNGIAGRNAYEWKLDEIVNGVYFCQVKAGTEKANFKIVVLR